MPTAISDIMQEFAKEMRSLYGDSLSSIIVYGSYARGDYTETSDIDVMILVTLPDEKIKMTTDMVSDCAFDFMMKYRVDISPIVKNVEHFAYWVDTLPYYRNIRDEGVRLSA
ncbi:nucleotidyltransferase domain-containing protein [Luxibacter massiliensis]|uniref:nucleotidyltransferase domain-containing protein n=1 Tax=Luxibacter massiliensis TaxID=2219695 RepID=UPI000F05B29C|nr:nucleotidyltransferase domain-containing protein [Luxibacter massiliensis]